MNDDADQLQLPHGAFIAFRQSGGLRFSTREVIVYDDGRVISRQQGKLGAGEGSRRLAPDEAAELKKMIEQSGLFGLPRFASIGRPSLDGYAYELIARVGCISELIKFFDGSIPPEVQSVLAWLKTISIADHASK